MVGSPAKNIKNSPVVGILCMWTFDVVTQENSFVQLSAMRVSTIIVIKHLSNILQNRQLYIIFVA